MRFFQRLNMEDIKDLIYVTSNPSIIGLLDFQEKDDGTTTINAYYYHQVDVKLSNKIVSIINNPSDCQD